MDLKEPQKFLELAMGNKDWKAATTLLNDKTASLDTATFDFVPSPDAAAACFHYWFDEGNLSPDLVTEGFLTALEKSKHEDAWWEAVRAMRQARSAQQSRGEGDGITQRAVDMDEGEETEATAGWTAVTRELRKKARNIGTKIASHYLLDSALAALQESSFSSTSTSALTSTSSLGSAASSESPDSTSFSPDVASGAGQEEDGEFARKAKIAIQSVREHLQEGFSELKGLDIGLGPEERSELKEKIKADFKEVKEEVAKNRKKFVEAMSSGNEPLGLNKMNPTELQKFEERVRNFGFWFCIPNHWDAYLVALFLAANPSLKLRPDAGALGLDRFTNPKSLIDAPEFSGWTAEKEKSSRMKLESALPGLQSRFKDCWEATPWEGSSKFWQAVGVAFTEKWSGEEVAAFLSKNEWITEYASGDFLIPFLNWEQHKDQEKWKTWTVQTEIDAVTSIQTQLHRQSVPGECVVC